MTEKFTITITNASGNKQTYALFNHAPDIAGLDAQRLWSNVVVTQKAAPEQQVTIEIVNDYHAIVGQKRHDADGTFTVSSQGSKPVTLGKVAADGTVLPGTTLSMIVEDGIPQFSTVVLPNSSMVGAFEIQTGDFDNATARREGYIIGVGPARSGGSIHGPSATFTPEAKSTYQIQPTHTYYVVAADISRGAVIDMASISKPAVLDFCKQSEYEIVHDAQGSLNVQKTEV